MTDYKDTLRFHCACGAKPTRKQAIKDVSMELTADHELKLTVYICPECDRVLADEMEVWK